KTKKSRRRYFSFPPHEVLKIKVSKNIITRGAIMMTSINMKKFDNILQNLPEDKRALAANLFEEMQFMKQTMAELKQLVQEQGTIQTFTQGQTSYPRENPALTAYNKTMGRYNQT